MNQRIKDALRHVNHTVGKAGFWTTITTSSAWQQYAVYALAAYGLRATRTGPTVLRIVGELVQPDTGDDMGRYPMPKSI